MSEHVDDWGRDVIEETALRMGVVLDDAVVQLFQLRHEHPQMLGFNTRGFILTMHNSGRELNFTNAKWYLDL